MRRKTKKATPTTTDSKALPDTFPDDPDLDPEGLDVRELRFADALAAGETQNDAAKAAGVSIRTARRWAHHVPIVAAVRARVTASLAQARAVLAAGSGRAAASLVAMGTGKRAATSPKVAAATKTIELATKLAELEDVVARLSELESRLSEKENAS
jgi:hypothetical protein